MDFYPLMVAKNNDSSQLVILITRKPINVVTIV